MASDGREVEIKLRVKNAEEALRLLREAGFHESKARVFEKNTIYDTEAADLRHSSRLLRLREIDNDYKLTFKGAPEPGKHKSREEIETKVEDGPAFVTILQRLGYKPTFRYEKYRAEYEAKNSGGVATVDETPIGTFLELEGEPDWIDRTARTLGYKEKDYITASYARLFFEWRERSGSTAAHMLFDLLHDAVSSDQSTGNRG
jgi:adenylate cyclase class 2